MAEGYPGYNAANALRGLLIYGGGDTAAALILGEFGLTRMLGMALVGATLYTVEVPNWFHRIDRRCPNDGSWSTTARRTAWALAYFNPLWIARHLLFIALFSGAWSAIGWELLRLGGWSFLVNIPIALIANWLIQNRLLLRWRFTASALFSAAMAVYYALAHVLFG